jgi:manganese oxidase
MAVVNQRLWAKQGILDMPDGLSVPFWGFATTPNGKPQLPGPFINAKVGDTIRITLRNDLNVVVSLIFPGQTNIPVPVKSNGVFVSFNTHALPGQTVQYTISALRPGVFLYESGTEPEKQVSMGLYGAILIHPDKVNNPSHPDYKTAYGSNTGSDFDIEKVLILSDLDSRLNSNAGTGNPFNILDFEPQYWLINGRSFPHSVLPDNVSFLQSQPVSSKVNAIPGQKVLLRLINAGSQNHTFRLEGLTARVVAIDGWPLVTQVSNASYLKNTIIIAAGESYDLIFTPGTVGQYYLHDRDLHHLCNVNQYPGGMATRLDVLGTNPPPGPPNAPIGLSATPHNSVLITWAHDSSNEEGFVVERKPDSGDFEVLAVLPVPGLTEYIDHGALSDNTYTYRVRAYNLEGFSEYSNTVTVGYQEPEGPYPELYVQYIQPKKVGDNYVFSVKFLCGTTSSNNPLVSATYRTTINVQNLSKHKQEFRTRVSVVDPVSGGVTHSTEHELEKYQTIQYDWEGIRELLNQFPDLQVADYIEGFVIIKTDSSKIQVVAVYSAKYP